MKEGIEEFFEVTRLAEMCLKLKGIDRPTIKEGEFKLQALRRVKKTKEHNTLQKIMKKLSVY